ncbi:MAG: serine/threonine-protein kinase [Gammaproteobacteria bacterium]
MWKQDWFFAFVITIVFFVVADSTGIQKLEWSLYDQGVRSSSRDPGDKIAVIAIDDESIANIGRWPWPRDVLASMISRLSEGGAKVISNTILLSEPQLDPGLVNINEALTYIQSSGLSSLNNEQINELEGILLQGQSDLDTDTKLGNSIKASGNVIMSTLFSLSAQGFPLGNLEEDLPAYLSMNTIKNLQGNIESGSPFPADAIFPPIELLGKQAAGIGHLNLEFYIDGSVRSELLAIDYYENIFPSLALLTAAKSLNLGPDDVQINRGESVSLGRLKIRTDPNTRMYPFFYQSEGSKSAFTEDSFYDVFQGKIPAEKYKDKIVLIGATAAGIGTQLNTPLAEPIQPAMFLAHTVASILNQDFFIVPEWAGIMEGRFGLVFLLVALYLILVLPKLNAALAATISFILFALLLGLSQYLLVSNAMWVQLAMPASMLFSGYLLLITKRFLVTERGKIRSDEESAESNRMLGLAFQQQGQLDMALEKFRKCPLDDSMMEPFYNLALDFERKRQFNKATSIYEYLVKHDAKFRDIKSRMDQSKKMSDTFMFGQAGGSGAGASLIIDASGVEKPMLGRYEVEKELGKGAMGVVYLGKDPKINRTVAIKTMALAQEFEADELEEVTSRFFREAETAGRLSHPNIVSIFDAGEEHDLAYIAMEFLKGRDLDLYTKKDKLLPITKVLELMALAADALGYAHKQNVVHRDIKPANIMYDPETNEFKITDFGIARITDSSKTKTGMILGTPSYMSPEQLSGKKVGGSSDLFSLGVMLYQLLCGELPFKGESMSSLMFMIASDPHRDIVTFRPELAKEAPCTIQIINKALEKDPDKRFQSGEVLAQYLRKCAQIISKAQAI